MNTQEFNELDVMLENVRLEDKVKDLERQLFLKEVELLTLKDENFSHIDVSKIDLDGIEMLERVWYGMGEDGLKLWLLRFFPKPIEIKNHKTKMMSEVPGIKEYLNNPNFKSKK